MERAKSYSVEPATAAELIDIYHHLAPHPVYDSAFERKVNLGDLLEIPSETWAVWSCKKEGVSVRMEDWYKVLDETVNTLTKLDHLIHSADVAIAGAPEFSAFRTSWVDRPFFEVQEQYTVPPNQFITALEMGLNLTGVDTWYNTTILRPDAAGGYTEAYTFSISSAKRMEAFLYKLVMRLIACGGTVENRYLFKSSREPLGIVVDDTIMTVDAAVKEAIVKNDKGYIRFLAEDINDRDYGSYTPNKRVNIAESVLAEKLNINPRYIVGLRKYSADSKTIPQYEGKADYVINEANREQLTVSLCINANEEEYKTVPWIRGDIPVTPTWCDLMRRWGVTSDILQEDGNGGQMSKLLLFLFSSGRLTLRVEVGKSE